MAENRDYNHLLRLAFPEVSRANTKRWRENNIEYRREYDHQRHLKDPHRFKRQYAKNPDRCRAVCKRFRLRHKDRISAEAKARRKEDKNWHLGCNLRCRMLQALKKNWKSGSAIQLLGCSINEFRLHLESRFELGMSWGNYGKGLGKWNIDHIIPVSRFNLIDPDQQEICFHFSNMQPMWAILNSSKGNKIL